MKPAQWAVAAALLAAMVFGLTYAMNYLQRPPETNHPSSGPDLGRDLELTFLTSKELPTGGGHIESELKTSSYQDFWFTNDNESPITLGLRDRGCRCSSVEVAVVPEKGVRYENAVASGVGIAASGPLAWAAGHVLGLAAVQGQSGLQTAELLKRADSLVVPPRALGWVRLNWKGEKAGALALTAVLWLNSKDSGRIASLVVNTFHYEPLRLRRVVSAGVVTDTQLNTEKGVSHDLAVWSSTRHDFKLEAKLRGRRDPATDPFSVGVPEKLSAEEVRILEKENNDGDAPAELGGHSGRVLSGYKIRVTMRGMAPDGKTPIDIGPFRRVVQFTSPDVGGEPLATFVQGRVRGLVELGNDDDGSGLDFLNFPRRSGAKTRLEVFSSVPGLKLEFDRKRTPEYLTATLTGPKPGNEVEKDRQVWSVFAQVPANKVSGQFPRAEDPLYEDSAVYLIATVPGKEPGKAPTLRSVRIPARGTADER